MGKRLLLGRGGRRRADRRRCGWRWDNWWRWWWWCILSGVGPDSPQTWKGDRRICWIPVALLNVHQVDYWAEGLVCQCFWVNSLMVTKGDNQSWEGKSGHTRLGYLSNLLWNHVTHIHLYLHHEPIDQASPIKINVWRIRGQSNVEVGKHTPSLG